MWFPFSIVFHCVKNQLSNENQRSAMNGGDVYWEESQNKNSQWDGIWVELKRTRIRVIVVNLSEFLIRWKEANLVRVSGDFELSEVYCSSNSILLFWQSLIFLYSPDMIYSFLLFPIHNLCHTCRKMVGDQTTWYT